MSIVFPFHEMMLLVKYQAAILLLFLSSCWSVNLGLFLAEKVLSLFSLNNLAYVTRIPYSFLQFIVRLASAPALIVGALFKKATTFALLIHIFSALKSCVLNLHSISFKNIIFCRSFCFFTLISSKPL